MFQPETNHNELKCSTCAITARMYVCMCVGRTLYFFAVGAKRNVIYALHDSYSNTGEASWHICVNTFT